MSTMKPCPKCGWPMETGKLPEPRGPHTYIRACTNSLCGWREWAAAPKNEGKRHDLKPARHILEKSDRPRVCEVCGRSAEELPAGQTLEVHHAIEISKGGTNDLDNLRWLCTEDHQWVTLRRRLYERARVYSGNGNGNHEHGD